MLVRRRPELLEAQARADSSLNVLFSLILHTRGFYGMLMFPHHIFFSLWQVLRYQRCLFLRSYDGSFLESVVVEMCLPYMGPTEEQGLVYHTRKWNGK